MFFCFVFRCFVVVFICKGSPKLISRGAKGEKSASPSTSVSKGGGGGGGGGGLEETFQLPR